MKFETVVIFSDDDIIDVIHGQNSELLRTLKKHEMWETIMEELDEQKVIIDNIDELEKAHQYILMSSPYSIRIKVFKNQNYKT